MNAAADIGAKRSIPAWKFCSTDINTQLSTFASLRSAELLQRTRGESLHLSDGDTVEPFEPIALGEAHLNELGIHTFQVGEHEQLLDGGVVTHIAI
jgi:hypothetical protein